MSDALLTRIAVALEKIAGNAPLPVATADAEPAKPRGRPPGSPNKPKVAEAAPTTAPEAEPETETATTAATPPVTDAQKAVTDAIKAGFREDVLKVLGTYGAKNASGVKETDRAAFIAELTALTDAAG